MNAEHADDGLEAAATALITGVLNEWENPADGESAFAAGRVVQATLTERLYRRPWTQDDDAASRITSEMVKLASAVVIIAASAIQEAAAANDQSPHEWLAAYRLN